MSGTTGFRGKSVRPYSIIVRRMIIAGDLVDRLAMINAGCHRDIATGRTPTGTDILLRPISPHSPPAAASSRRATRQIGRTRVRTSAIAGSALRRGGQQGRADGGRLAGHLPPRQQSQGQYVELASLAGRYAD